MRKRYINKFSTKKLLESEDFPYVIAVWQSKTRKCNPNTIAITTKSIYLAKKFQSILEEVLNLPVYFTEIHYNRPPRKSYRVVFWSKKLADFLRQKTRSNTKIPSRLINTPKKERSYLQGLLDSRASVSYCPKEFPNGFRAQYPKITITKADNTSLLEGLAELFKKREIKFRQRRESITINTRESIEKILGENLLTSEEKKQKLWRFHQTYIATKKWNK